MDRGLPTCLVPNRDIGAMIYGDLWGGIVRYEAGVFNGVPDGGSSDSTDIDQGKDVAARLFLSPFKNTGIAALKGLSFGVAGTAGERRSLVPSYRTAGGETFFSYHHAAFQDGRQTRLSPQLFWGIGPVAILAEYVASQQVIRCCSTVADLKNTAWQVAASWAITGEAVTFGGVKVKRPTFAGGPGAFLLAGRYGELDVDNNAFFAGLADPGTAASEAQSFGLALHWYPNDNVRFSIAWDRTTFEVGARDGLQLGDRETESVITAQSQLSF